MLVPAPVRAPLEVEFVDGRLRPARPGDGLGEDAHERARQAWQALRDFLADLADIRPRIVNQLPQLERALTRLEDAFGDDYEAANAIAMGIHGDHVIEQAGAAGETMAETDAAAIRSFAAELDRFLQRFPAWLAYRDEGASARAEPPRIEDVLPEIEAIAEELRDHDAIDPAIPESLEKQAEDVRINPGNPTAKRGLKDSLNNVLGRICEALVAGGSSIANEAKDLAVTTWKMIKVGSAYKAARWVLDTEEGLVAVARSFFHSRVAELKKLAEDHPAEFGWLVSFLKQLGL